MRDAGNFRTSRIMHRASELGGFDWVKRYIRMDFVSE